MDFLKFLWADNGVKIFAGFLSLIAVFFVAGYYLDNMTLREILPMLAILSALSLTIVVHAWSRYNNL
jgi:hypothetical protein